MAPAASVAGVLMIAGMGVLLAFIGTPRPVQKSASSNDQKSRLTAVSSLPAPPRARAPRPGGWPTDWANGWGNGRPGQVPGPTPALARAPGALDPDSWLEPVRPPARHRDRAPQPQPPMLGLPPVMSPWVTPAQSPRQPAPAPRPGTALPEALDSRQETAPSGPVPSPSPQTDDSQGETSTPAARVAASPAPAAPPHPRTLPAPAAEPDVPAGPAERRRQEPETASAVTGDPLPAPDPCATFPDFRRDYCYRLLGGR